MRHEVGGPILRAVHHLQDLMPLAGEIEQEIIIRSIRGNLY